MSALSAVHISESDSWVGAVHLPTWKDGGTRLAGCTSNSAASSRASMVLCTPPDRDADTVILLESGPEERRGRERE